MSVRVSNAAEVKADLYGRITTDGEYEMLFGETANGDIPLSMWQYDASSSASDDFEGGVIKPTLQTGNGRWLRRWKLIQPDWNQSDDSAQDYIKNKPNVSILAPSGAITMYGAAAAPSGWLLCDGSAVSRSTYADLFAVIGTTYGMGNGSTTFNVPDMRQRFPLGKASSGTGANLGDAGGNIDHIHTVDPPNTTSSAPSATVTGIALLGVAGAASDTHTHTVNIAEFNSGANNPAYLTVNYIIKT